MKRKRILIINGHPDKISFSMALADAYQKGATDAGHDVQRINITDLKFDPILHNGYRIIQPLEPDLIKTQEAMQWAEHLVFVFPTWWADVPALMKGFVDRIFLPGFGFRYHKNSLLWDKLLKGRTCRVITTMTTPLPYNLWRYRSKGQQAFIKGTLEFCGIGPVRSDFFDVVRFASPQKREKWLRIAEKRGRRGV